MHLQYKKANIADAKCLIELYNAAFYADFIRYGACPAYGKTKEKMENSISAYPKYIIIKDGKPIGSVSFENRGNGVYYLGCLCVIPEFQGRGIGTKAMKDLLLQKEDWKTISLITPADKTENIDFYTKRFGFHITGKSLDGTVAVAHLCLER